MKKCSFCGLAEHDIMKSALEGSDAAICERCVRDLLAWFEAWRKERVEMTYEASKKST